jgi:protein-disulfide isomerase
MESNNSKTVAVAIVLAAVIVGIAVAFLGQQLMSRPDEARVVALIEERLGQANAAASDAEFNARVEKGIVAFIEKQQRAQADRPNQLAKNVPPPSPEDHVYGNPDAPISLIEYSDFECPYCQRFHETAKQLVDGSNGQVNWIYRHFPIPSHRGAAPKAAAAECAAELGGKEAFWRYSDGLFERTGQGFLKVDQLVPLAGRLGLDKGKFQQCLDSGRFNQKVQAQMRGGERAGVTGTPGNILYHRQSGNVAAMHGAQPLERLYEAVNALSNQRQ